MEGVTLKDRERLFSTAVDVTLGISLAPSPDDHDRAARCSLFGKVVVDPLPSGNVSCCVMRAVPVSLFVVTLRADPSYPIERCGFEYLRTRRSDDWKLKQSAN